MNSKLRSALGVLALAIGLPMWGCTLDIDFSSLDWTHVSDSAPFKTDGLAVGFKVDWPKLDPAQRKVVESTEVRAWLDANCAMGPDGVTPEYRVLDVNDSKDKLKNESKVWREAMAVDTSDPPSPGYMIVAKGHKGLVCPIPMGKTAVQDTLDLLKPFEKGDQ